MSGSTFFPIPSVLAAGVIELFDIWVIFPFSVMFLVASVFVLQLLDHRTGIVLEKA
jgi:hypothetical protein